MNKQVEVVAAVIHDAEGRIFATQRGYGEWKDWWEFPGGKIEPGETPEEALHREIREELNAEIDIERLLQTIHYDYPEFHLILHCYGCKLKKPEIRGSESESASDSIILMEHEAARWLKTSELHTVRWLPADEEIIQTLGKPEI